MTTEAAREAILGVWKLTSYGDRDGPDLPWTMTFGERPSGIALYHRSGTISMQVFADPASPSLVEHVGYIGTFTVREAHPTDEGFSGVLEHMMHAASDSALLEEDGARPFGVNGNRLVLGDEQTWQRTFERLS